MYDITLKMIELSIDAFERGDITLALEIIEMTMISIGSKGRWSEVF